MSTNMLRAIVDGLNAPPLNRNTSVISFDSLSAEKLLQTLSARAKRTSADRIDSIFYLAHFRRRYLLDRRRCRRHRSLRGARRDGGAHFERVAPPQIPAAIKYR